MKKTLWIISIIAISISSTYAATYQQDKQKIRSQLIKCLKEPENAKHSAAFNSCLIDAATEFQNKAQIEFDTQYNTNNSKKYEQESLIKNRRIFLMQIKSCEIYQELSFDGFGEEATCKLLRSQDYYRYLKNANGMEKWTLENRVDNLFLGY